MAANDPLDLKFTSREVTAWGGLALLKRMLDGLDFKAALRVLEVAPAWLQSQLRARAAHRANDRQHWVRSRSLCPCRHHPFGCNPGAPI